VQIAAQKQSATTPAQVLKELPSALPTGAPQTATATGTIAKQTSQPDGKGAVEASTGAASLPSNPIPKPGQAADAILPAADLKPLHDFGLDCKACQAKLAARAT
jgi:hypothetical protein